MSALDELLELVKGQEHLERLAALTRDAFAKQRAVNEALLIYGAGSPELEAALREALK